MSFLAKYSHHLILFPTVLFTYAAAGVDKLAATAIAAGGLGLWLHAHAHTHEG